MRRLFALAPAAAGWLLACGLHYPEVQDDRLVVVALLDPDSAVHMVWARPIATAAARPSVTARLYRGARQAGEFSWTLVATAEGSERPQCGGQWAGSNIGARSTSLCVDPGAPLDPGAAYMVEVSAGGYRTARGHTLVVGDFEVQEAVLTTAGASATLDASWTRSIGAHRYFVALRRLHPPYVANPKGWYADVDGTSIATVVPDSAIDDAVPPITLDVAAASRELHAYMTSGMGGGSLSVPPLQNVENGFGVVGSIRFRSLPVESR